MSLKSTSSFMAELSVLELLDKYNFFVPEIQREYVWGKNNRNILASFCDDIIAGREQKPDDNLFQQKMKKLVEENKYDEISHLLNDKDKGNPINIGFLYSYKPNYKMDNFPDSDLFSDTYLIDGQQRFTTLFLILFYLAVKENRLGDFKVLFRFNQELSSIAFDYRVRNLTHDFVIKLISEVQKEAEFDSISDAVWFLDIYSQDVTINSMVNALWIIKNAFKDQDSKYFDFMLKQIRFWHFKTEKTNQGEELYITMNSRGKQLEDNETVRAKLFEEINDSDQAIWSEKWEKWQDFFWKNRSINNSADEGFNEFLKCIAGLQSYLAKKDQFVAEHSHIQDYHLYSNLSLEIIEKYFNAFSFIFAQQTNFAEQYEYAKWVSLCNHTLRDIIFKERTNWFVDYNDDNKATERRRMVFAWSILIYVAQADATKTTDDIYRLIRIYWLRYNNYDRAVSNIFERVQTTITDGCWAESTSKEEKIKHRFYKNQKSDDSLLKQFESRIWKIEDHRLNISGYQVDQINSSHLIDYESLVNYKTLDNIYQRFVLLFPEDKTDYASTINNVLMFYGFYGMRRTPYYYYNYDFSSWRRIVRDLDSSNKAFSTFFSDFDGSNLEELKNRKETEFLAELDVSGIDSDAPLPCSRLVDALKLYIILCEDIWPNGRYIAYEERWSDISALTTFERNQHNVKPYKMLYNTKGSFRGYGFSTLFGMLPDNYKEILLRRKNSV